MTAHDDDGYRRLPDDAFGNAAEQHSADAAPAVGAAAVGGAGTWTDRPPAVLSSTPATTAPARSRSAPTAGRPHIDDFRGNFYRAS